jgi:dienelactone hydrolase
MVVGATTARALVPVTGATLVGDLSVPVAATALILLPHGGSGSARSHRRLAAALGDEGLATLCLGLLTQTEDVVDVRTGHFRFDIPLLATRLIAATDWVLAQSATSGLRVGYFGASTGAAAALIAAAARPKPVSAVVCQSGRPDLAVHVLDRVQAPTLLIVGGDDLPVIELNRDALKRLHVEAVLQVVPGASHLFDEPGAMDIVADLARGWFGRHLGRASDS